MIFQGALTLSGTLIHVQHEEACPDIGPICASQPQQPYQHDQHLYSTDLVFDGELGLTPHLSVELIAGVRQVTDRIRYLDLAGAPYTPPIPDFHHRNETLVGPTDPWLMLHGGVSLGAWTLSAKGGVTLPLGSTVTNPFVLGREGLPHEHIQLGTGTFDPVAGASVGRHFEAFDLSLWTLDRFTFGTNSHDFQAGHKLFAGAQLGSGFGLVHWTFVGGVDLARETPERWSGVIEEEGNLGRTDVLVDASAAWHFSRRFSATLDLKVPVFTRAQGEQASFPAIVSIGVSTVLGTPDE